MTNSAPLFASERTAARLLDMKPVEFRALVNKGALPAAISIGDEERWDMDGLSRILRGQAAIPQEDFEI